MRTRRTRPPVGPEAKSPVTTGDRSAGGTPRFAWRCIAPRRSPVRVRLAPSRKALQIGGFFVAQLPLNGRSIKLGIRIGHQTRVRTEIAETEVGTPVRPRCEASRTTARPPQLGARTKAPAGARRARRGCDRAGNSVAVIENVAKRSCRSKPSGDRIGPVHPLTFAEIEQAADPPLAGRQGWRGDPTSRLTIDPVEMRTFGEYEGSYVDLSSDLL